MSSIEQWVGCCFLASAVEVDVFVTTAMDKAGLDCGLIKVIHILGSLKILVW